MTQTGKCDTCRQRKVKCDEERPKCGACLKKDRPCSYSYGKASAFVVQDPNQLTKHGRSKVAPVVYAIDASTDTNSPSDTTPSDLLVTTERAAENGHGLFQTLAPSSKRGYGVSKKKSAFQKRTLEAYIQLLQDDTALSHTRPSSPETMLIARYINMLGPQDFIRQPLSILGTWISSIPARMGSNRMLDLAVEFLVNSYAVFWDETHTKRKAARASKAKALRELQLNVSHQEGGPSYDILLVTKMHYAAEAMMGIDSMYHAIHAFGLAELLKAGNVSNVDDEHYWNLVDNTYIDDVNEAMLAGRQSVYDNEYYLSVTYPPSMDSDTRQLSPSHRASMAIMHVFIQCPRLVMLIRKAVLHPDDKNALAAAMSLVEYLVQIDLPKHVSALLEASISIAPVAASPEMADIMPDSLECTSVQDMILCTRYWMLRNVLCGMADTLYRHFPVEAALSLLPSAERVREVDIDSALHLAKTLPWAESISFELPLATLRLHTPLQLSIGPWHRIIRQVTLNLQDAGQYDAQRQSEMRSDLARAVRMKDWLIERCNQVHKQWDVSVVDEKPLLQALDSMAGEAIPDWLPVRVRFEAEDGEMVLKLEYENRTGTFSERFDLTKQSPKKFVAPSDVGQEWQRENVMVHELPLRTNASNTSTTASGEVVEGGTEDSSTYSDWSNTRPVDFIHSTGRNLCSTSGWWPTSSNSSTLLLDSTHKASAFSNIRPRVRHSDDPHPLLIDDEHPCLASSWWPQMPNSSVGSSLSAGTPDSAVTPSTWSEITTVTFDNEKKNGCFSPAWSNKS